MLRDFGVSFARSKYLDHESRERGRKSRRRRLNGNVSLTLPGEEEEAEEAQGGAGEQAAAEADMVGQEGADQGGEDGGEVLDALRQGDEGGGVLRGDGAH